MNFPQLPTDNLYKFIALSGVAILLFSLYIPYTFSYQYLEARSKFSIELKKAKAEVDFNKNEIKDLVNIRDSYIARKTKEKTWSEGKIPVILSEDEVKKKVERLLELNKASDIKLAEIDGLEDNLTILSTRNQRISCISYFTIVLGSFLTCFGFIMWYMKVQVYQDKILKRESQKGND